MTLVPFHGAPLPRGRAACIELLGELLNASNGGPLGVALFVLDCNGTPAPRGVRSAQRSDRLAADIARRLRASAPLWHRLLRGDDDEFIVIAQGMVDGAAVLATAARLVHAFDDALHVAEAPDRPDVSIGIAYAPQHGRNAHALLEAAQASLRDAAHFAHGPSCLAS